MRCHSVGFGTVNRTQSRTQSVTQGFTAVRRDAVIRVYDETGNVIEMHERMGDLKEW
jgi:hypothetical protein